MGAADITEEEATLLSALLVIPVAFCICVDRSGGAATARLAPESDRPQIAARRDPGRLGLAGRPAHPHEIRHLRAVSTDTTRPQYGGINDGLDRQLFGPGNPSGREAESAQTENPW